MRRSGVGSVKSLDGACSRPGALECQRKMRKVSIEVVGMSMQVLRGKGKIFAGGREGFVQVVLDPQPPSMGREEVVMVLAHTQPPDFRGFFFRSLRASRSGIRPGLSN